MFRSIVMIDWRGDEQTHYPSKEWPSSTCDQHYAL